MFEPQNDMDLQEKSGFGGPRSWLSGEIGDGGGVNSSAGSNLDRVLFNDLVEIVPLVQTLIDRKASSSFTRRGSMVYTKTPSRELLSRKGRNAAQSMPNKKKKDHGEKEQGKNGSGNDRDGDSFMPSPPRGSVMEKESEELILLKGQLDELQTKLSDKDELLKSAEIKHSQLLNQLEELKRESSEKDSVIKSIQLQLSDTKIKLADKQAALEKTRWEALTSGKRVEMLQEELSNVRGEVSLLMSIFNALKDSNAITCCGDYDLAPYYLNDDSSPIDDLDPAEMHRMEEARLAYIAAVAAAKEKQDEESMAVAAQARLHLQSFVFGAEC